MKKIILGTALAFVALTMTSCLHDNEELFDTPAAERLEQAVKADKELLESAANGWQMRYYTGRDYTGGGYTMYMKFKNGKASVSSDIAPASMVTTSSYDVTKDQGPVLTFNTYNVILHYLAQPYQSDVDGEQGDYEFVITRTTQDSIYVTGKKWGNKFVMTRVPADQSWKESINKMQSIIYAMPFSYMPVASTSEQDRVMIDPTLRRIYIGDDVVDGVPFYMTTEGIAMQTPVTIAGKEVSELKYNATAKTLTSADGALTLNNTLPAGYRPMSEFVGTWNMKFDNYDYSTKKYFEDWQTFTLFPLTDLIQQPSFSAMAAVFKCDNYDMAFRMAYSPLTGKLSIPAQFIDDPSNSGPALLLAACYIDDKGYVQPSVQDFNIVEDENGDMKVVCDDPQYNSIVLFTLNGKGQANGIFYLWENVSDFVSAVQ